MNFEQIVEDMAQRIAMDEEFSREFYTTVYDGKTLSQYHHNLGTWIRNTYNLWEIKWEPVIIDGADHSPFHPDQLSMTIIEEVWKRGQK